ncbi:MAG: DNA mismatch repair protein MutS, partial [Prevotella sp.]|nr:DNA mismatch repair protein MutS [Prevotella sp.]
QQFMQMFGTNLCTYEMDDWVFSEQTATQKLHHHFKVKNMKGFGVEMLKEGLVAAGAILQYLEQTQHTQISHITRLQRIDAERYVRLDSFTIRNLELNAPLHEGGTALIDVIDNTISPMGARMLRRWLVFPLREQNRINERLDVVDYFFRQPDSRDVIEDELHRIGDMERIVSKVAVGRVTPREIVQLKSALTAIKPIKVICMQSDTEVLKRVGEKLDTLDELREHIDTWLVPDPPAMIGKGNVINSGVNPQLDELRQIAFSGKDYLLKIQEREINNTGIASLKIGYNNVFGYYLEVRNTYKDNVPSDWIRKQTLAQAERYITQELKEYEDKILGAEDKILGLETKLYAELITYVQQFIEQLQRDAHLIAELDCLLSFAKTSVSHHYVRPVIDDSNVIDIKQGRHPVIEANMPIGEQYVPNDVYLNNDNQQIIIITGPNMAGKSALLRQTALIVLLAQIGCYVPADAAHIGLVDKIFTRVGASDSLSTGESTFMVEMTEAANILNNVSDRSLVLFDELGRGTSTYDGISIAWAIVEYLHEHKGSNARTLFATHYHELNEMQNHYPRIKNYNVSVKEINGKVIFLRKLVEGGSEHSFGIHVAQLAGLPPAIVNRANEVLKALEKEASQVGAAGKKETRDALNNITEQGGGAQLSFFQLDDPVLEQIRDEILNADINNLTPLEALNKLSEIKKLVGGK